MDLVRIQHRLDDFQRRRPPLAFLVALADRVRLDRGGQKAALLAYYGFVSLFPLLLVLVTVLQVVLAGDPELQEQVVDTALSQIPVVGDELKSIGPSGSRGWILVGGTLVALWAGLRVLDTLQAVLEQLWGIPPTDRTGLIARKARSLVLLAILATALGAVAAIGVGVSLIELPQVGRILSLVLTIALAAGVVLASFVLLETGGPGWREQVPGALFAGAGWVVLQQVGTWFISARVQGASGTYGAFGIVLGLLAWLVLLGWLMVIAIELNVVLNRRAWPVPLFPDLEGSEPEPAQTDDAVRSDSS